MSDPRAAERVVHPGGMNASRVMPTGARDHLDPFVVFERFYIEPHQGFDTHPHRGFEIISYMLEGAMAHADSMGHESVAREGDAMRVTTGSGMRHSEMPDEGAACNGLQLWVNLPRDEKTVEPSYEDASAEELPVRETDGATVTTVVGEGSPLSLHTPVSYEVAALSGAWTWSVPEGWNGFAYGIDGEGTADGEAFGGGDFIDVEGGGETAFDGEGLRVACIAGRPHGEPIRQRGPFVE
ncbi:pirin family protein [Halosegnis marinus]|uniref:Pirin family protein n=1 Tax=Halosegnis marinus TaxID=3034023 RepID=A0ABD5ZMP2_9EURY|nr:pirin family protein [Halosegnis sp. DT85]